MPQQEQTITLNNLDKETALAIAYQTLQNLDWSIQFAGENKLLARTIKKWNSSDQQILIDTDGSQLSVISEMIHNESFDLRGKNKKNLDTFFTAFDTTKNSIDTATIENNKLAINALRELTIKTVETETAEAEEVNKAMNLAGSNLYVTYAIIAINVLVFVLMVMDGAGIVDANSLVHIKWGSNYTPLTLSGDWWRLITNVFIHFGIIHLLMNMYCLYTVGVYLEPMLGKIKYTVAYLCTGVLASVVSLWWHKDGVNGAGASGAIFGMYGLFLALLTTNLIPKKVRNALLQSIGIFIFYNLAYGMKSGVDNSAHIGGLISGFIIGYIYTYVIKKEKQEQKLQWILPVIIGITLASAIGYLQQNKVSVKERAKELAYVDASNYKDNDKFNEVLAGFDALQDKAVAPLSDTTFTNAQLKEAINTISYPAWIQASTKLTETKNYSISPAMHTKANKLLEYVALRQKELTILIEMIDTGKQEELMPELDSARKSMNKIVIELQAL